MRIRIATCRPTLFSVSTSESGSCCQRWCEQCHTYIRRCLFLNSATQASGAPSRNEMLNFGRAPEFKTYTNAWCATVGREYANAALPHRVCRSMLSNSVYTRAHGRWRQTSRAYHVHSGRKFYSELFFLRGLRPSDLTIVPLAVCTLSLSPVCYCTPLLR